MSSGLTRFVYLDRLGSETTGLYPWGEEKTTTQQNTEKFATYFRDSTNLDYAVQRYYSSIMGRFLTPDPAGVRAVSLANPQSWNRYSYVVNDPVNLTDPTGEITEGLTWFEQLASYLGYDLYAKKGKKGHKGKKKGSYPESVISLPAATVARRSSDRSPR